MNAENTGAYTGGGVHPGVDLFFVLLHSLSCLASCCSASSINQSGSLQTSHKMIWISQVHSHLLIRTSCLKQQLRSAPSIAVHFLQEDTASWESWKWSYLLVFAGSRCEQLRATLHQLCQWASPAFFQPDCHCPGRGNETHTSRWKAPHMEWAEAASAGEYPYGEAGSWIDLGLLSSTNGIIVQRAGYLITFTNSVVN